MTRIDSFQHDGLTFDVRDTGPLDGPVVVLLHGFPQTGTSWAAPAELLNKRGYRTIVPDQRGYSQRARPRGRFAYRTSRLVADNVALINTIGSPVHLVGHDWGAVVAWSTATLHPGLVQSLTTVSVPHPAAFLRSMLSSGQAFRSYYMAVFQIPWLPELLLRAWPKAFYRMLAGHGMTPDQLTRVRQEIIEGGALTGGLNWYRAMLFSSPKPLRTKVTVPTTHVWSDGDKALARKGADLTSEYVTADYRLEILTGVSHWIPEEVPEAITDIIESRVQATRTRLSK